MSTTQWLIQFLQENGPTRNREVLEAARAAGIRSRGLEYAKKQAGLNYDRELRYQGATVLRLPGQEPLPGTNPDTPEAKLRRSRGISKGNAKRQTPKRTERVEREVDETRPDYTNSRMTIDHATKIVHVFLAPGYDFRVYDLISEA